jgi:hypothetical protein
LTGEQTPDHSKIHWAPSTWTTGAEFAPNVQWASTRGGTCLVWLGTLKPPERTFACKLVDPEVAALPSHKSVIRMAGSPPRNLPDGHGKISALWKASHKADNRANSLTHEVELGRIQTFTRNRSPAARMIG